MRSSFVCTLFCLFGAGSLYAEQASMAELSKNLPEDKVQTINGRWMIKVRVPIEGTASTARKIAHTNAESIGKGRILEYACSPQRDGHFGRLVGIITELATNRISVESGILEVIMSAPVQKPKCTFEASDSKKNTSGNDLQNPGDSKQTHFATRASTPTATSTPDQPSSVSEMTIPVTSVRETGSDY